MNAGIISLVLAYVLSQFYRAFLAVMAPELEASIGATPADLALASGVWFLVFACMQIPIGELLDRIGPRLTSSVMFAMGGAGGAVVFAMASVPWHISVAMGLIGFGCAPVLMASYYIFARSYLPAVFATLAGVTLGIGNLGNIGSSLPMSMAVETFGWRGTMWVLASVTLLVAVAAFLFVRDPEKVDGSGSGSVLDLLKMPVIWPILAIMTVNYVPAAGLRGLWAGPYLNEVFAASAASIGLVTLVMSVAMAAGNFIFGPLDRLIASRKAIVLGGNVCGVISVGLLILFAGNSIAVSAILLAMIGLSAGTFVVIIAHAKTFFPEHLMGRGVTLLNLFGIGGVGVFQSLSGRVYNEAAIRLEPVAAHQVLFGFFGCALLLGCIVYAFSRDGRNEG